MKKVICIILIVLSLVAAGCRKNSETNKKKTIQEDYGDDFKLGIDDQYLCDSSRVTITTDKGYYILVDGYLVFYDKNIEKLVPVCGKINCSHNSNDCNANLTVMGHLQERICLYKGFIYYIYQNFDGNYILERISTDGSKREELEVLFKTREEGAAINLMAHRGYIYFTFDWNERDREKHTHEIYRKSLEKEGEKEIIFEYTGYSILFTKLQGQGNEVTFTCNEILDIDNPDEERSVSYSYNILTGETSELTAVDDGTKNEVWLLTKDTNASYYYHLDYGLVKVDENGCQNLYQPNIEGYTLIYCDGNHFYFDNLVDAEDENKNVNRKIWVVNKEGVETAVMEEGLVGRFMGGDGNKLFMHDRLRNVLQVWDASRLKEGVASYEEVSIMTGSSLE